MKSTSSALLDLEAESKSSFSSFESKLLICNGGSDLQSQVSKLNPTAEKPEISSTSQSQVLDKVKNFLGVLSDANKKLEVDAKENPKKYDIEELTHEDSEYIEMNLMLGVAELYSSEAVAAAESAIARQQPVIPLASSSPMLMTVATKMMKKANSETNRSQSPEREVSSSKGSNSSGSKRGILLKPQFSNSHRTSMATREQLGTFEFSFDEICQATGNFSAVHKIGEGGFGTVYKGKLKNGFPVAIKRAKKDLRVLAEFKNEVQALSKIEHLNLVRFYGFLELRDERIIITEYVSNGTLRDHLDGKNGTEFEVAERLSIAIDVAHAITYLHSYTDPPIIHRDIKASNILITENLHAKVADFGFARLAAEDSCATHISTQIKGTAGYLDPEYLRTYQLTEKSDVYSFGVLLVEMMTGRHPIETNRTIDERVTIKWAMRILKHGDSVIAMDPRLRRSPASIEAVEKVLKLARQCLAPSRLARPAMKKCAEVLWGIRTQFVEKSIPKTSTSSHSTNFLDRNAKRDWEDLYTVNYSKNYKFVST